jgi:hypothetical protein
MGDEGSQLSVAMLAKQFSHFLVLLLDASYQIINSIGIVFSPEYI